MLFSGLLKFNDRGESIPDVALAAPTKGNGGISPDGKTITFHLRRGVVFSDGHPLTAEDVVFTWQQVLNPKNNVPYHYPNDQAESVTAPDPYTVVVKLKVPSAPFLSYFMRDGNQRAILPKHLLERESDLNKSPFNLKPVGSGPFMVARWQPGVELDLVANPRYWRGPPKLREIRYRIIPNDNSLLSSLRSHDIDFWQLVPAGQYALVKSIEGVIARVIPSLTFEHLEFNTKHPPLDDVRVRRALAHAIDWQTLREKVYFNLGSVGMSDIPPGTWAHDDSVKPYAHDPAQAKALLAEAGWLPGADGIVQKNGTRLSLTISTTAGARDRESAEVVIQQALHEVGVELQVRNHPANLLFASLEAGGIINSGKYDIALYGWTKYPDPDDSDTIGPDSTPPRGANSTFWSDAAIGRWQKAATARYRESERAPYYRLVQQRIHEFVPMHTVIWRSTLDAYNADLKNFKPGLAAVDYWNIWEWEI